jgi:enterochelin esterase-like enzyme
VSLGGVIALRAGLLNAASFGYVGGIQPAFGVDEVGGITELALAARSANPKLALRLMTSSDDYFREPVQACAAAWAKAGIAHDLVDVPGPHDYPFNRGPGAIELLYRADRALALA